MHNCYEKWSGYSSGESLFNPTIFFLYYILGTANKFSVQEVYTSVLSHACN